MVRQLTSHPFLPAFCLEVARSLQQQCGGIGSENKFRLADTSSDVKCKIIEERNGVPTPYLVESVNVDVGVGVLLNNLQRRGHYAGMLVRIFRVISI
jgi:hypothetical protein